MKKAYENLKDDMNKQKNNELEQLKLQIAALTMREESKNLQAFREDISDLKKKYFLISQFLTFFLKEILLKKMKRTNPIIFLKKMSLIHCKN